MGFRKSTQCVGKGSGQYLMEYDCFEDAQAGADHAQARYGSASVSYPCHRCGLWHLAPRDRQTPSTPCSYCQGADGKPKDAYDTAQNAERRADILYRERGVSLRVYECPHGQGWHLTKG